MRALQREEPKEALHSLQLAEKGEQSVATIEHHTHTHKTHTFSIPQQMADAVTTHSTWSERGRYGHISVVME